MLYPVIYNIINEYSSTIKIINKNTFKYKCSQCRDFYYHYNLKETKEQSTPSSPRIYCCECRILMKRYYFFTYKKFK